MFSTPGEIAWPFELRLEGATDVDEMVHIRGPLPSSVDLGKSSDSMRAVVDGRIEKHDGLAHWKVRFEPTRRAVLLFRHDSGRVEWQSVRAPSGLPSLGDRREPEQHSGSQGPNSWIDRSAEVRRQLREGTVSASNASGLPFASGPAMNRLLAYAILTTTTIVLAATTGCSSELDENISGGSGAQKDDSDALVTGTACRGFSLEEFSFAAKEDRKQEDPQAVKGSPWWQSYVKVKKNGKVVTIRNLSGASEEFNPRQRLSNTVECNSSQKRTGQGWSELPNGCLVSVVLDDDMCEVTNRDGKVVIRTGPANARR